MNIPNNTNSPLILYNTVSFSAVARVQKTAPLNFCTPPDQYQANGELVLYNTVSFSAVAHVQKPLRLIFAFLRISIKSMANCYKT